FPRAQVDFPECCERGGYAVQFILKSGAFLMEFADYRLHQCLWHRAILSPAFGRKPCGPTEDFDSRWRTNSVRSVDERQSPHVSFGFFLLGKLTPALVLVDEIHTMGLPLVRHRTRACASPPSQRII